MSMMWWNWWRMAPWSVITRGHETINGSRVPPSWTNDLYIRLGVLPAIAQPDAQCGCVWGAPQSSMCSSISATESGAPFM